MLRLRFFACQGCETVFADPEEPSGCDCGTDAPMKEITDDLQADPYFTKVHEPDR